MVALLCGQGESLKHSYLKRITDIKDSQTTELIAKAPYLELNYDRLEQYSRIQFIRVRGIPEPGEASSPEDTHNVIV